MSMSRADILYHCIVNHKVFDRDYDPKIIDWIAELYDIAEGKQKNECIEFTDRGESLQDSKDTTC